MEPTFNKIELEGWLIDRKLREVQSEEGTKRFITGSLLIIHPTRRFQLCYMPFSCFWEIGNKLLDLPLPTFVRFVGKFGYNYSSKIKRKFFNVFVDSYQVIGDKPLPDDLRKKRKKEDEQSPDPTKEEEVPF